MAMVRAEVCLPGSLLAIYCAMFAVVSTCLFIRTTNVAKRVEEQLVCEVEMSEVVQESLRHKSWRLWTSMA